MSSQNIKVVLKRKANCLLLKIKSVVKERCYMKEADLIKNEKEYIDYTKWHENLSDTMSVREFSKKAMEYKNSQNNDSKNTDF
jgi:hypothetical protein